MLFNLLNRKILVALGLLTLMCATGCMRMNAGIIHCEGTIGAFDVMVKKQGGTQWYDITVVPTDLDFTGDTVSLALSNSYDQVQPLASYVQVYEQQPLTYASSENIIRNYNALVIYPAEGIPSGDAYNAVCQLPDVSNVKY